MTSVSFIEMKQLHSIPMNEMPSWGNYMPKNAQTTQRLSQWSTLSLSRISTGRWTSYTATPKPVSEGGKDDLNEACFLQHHIEHHSRKYAHLNLQGCQSHLSVPRRHSVINDNASDQEANCKGQKMYHIGRQWRMQINFLFSFPTL